MSSKEVEYIKKEILETGFPLELDIYSLLASTDWIVSAQDYFFDEEEKKGRSIDISAMNFPIVRNDSLEETLNPLILDWNLAIECKKSSKYEWIFFPIEDYYVGIDGQVLSFLKDNNNVSLFTYLFGSKFGHYNPSETKIATIYTTVPVKRKNRERCEIFEAVMQLIKYISYSRNKIRNRNNVSKYSINVWFPIIVFDGKMWNVSIDDGKIIDISETKHVILKVNYKSPYLKEEEYFALDIIHKSRFKELINIINNDMKEFTEKVLKKKSDMLSRFG